MRHMTVGAVAIAMLFVLAPATSAKTPATEAYNPTFTRADLFLHRNTSPVGNVDASEGRFVKWDATKPTGAQPALYIGNNYGGIVEGDHLPQHFLTMEGVASGDLDTIAFDLYFNGPGQSSIGCSLSLSFEVVVDDVEVLYQNYTGSDLGMAYEAIDETTYRARFALTNLWKASQEYELPTGPDVQHDIYINMQNFYLCNEFVWQYDSADRPAGLIVNLEKPGKKGYTEVDVLNPPPPVEATASISHRLA